MRKHDHKWSDWMFLEIGHQWRLCCVRGCQEREERGVVVRAAEKTRGQDEEGCVTAPAP